MAPPMMALLFVDEEDDVLVPEDWALVLETQVFDEVSS